MPDYISALENVLREINSGNISPPLTRPPGLPDTPNLPTLEFGIGGKGSGQKGFFEGRGSVPTGVGSRFDFGLRQYPGMKPSPYFGFGVTREY